MAEPETRTAVAGTRAEVFQELTKDFKDVQKGAALLHVAISVVLLGAQPSFIGLLTNPLGFTEKTAQFYLDVLKQCAPLTLSIALVFVMWWTLWRKAKDVEDFLTSCPYMIGATGLVLGVVMWTANKLGAAIPAAQLLRVNLPFAVTTIINDLYSYLVAYHMTLFLSSLLVGGYMGWVYVWKVHPRVRCLWTNEQEGPGRA